MSRNGNGNGQDQAARLWLSWLLVAVLLGYGVIQTGITAAKLFTG